MIGWLMCRDEVECTKRSKLMALIGYKHAIVVDKYNQLLAYHFQRKSEMMEETLLPLV
jgi:hypothetical protein